MFFKKLKSVVSQVDLKTGLSKDYDRIYALFLVQQGSEESTTGEFNIMRGREVVFRYCVDYVVTGEYDLLKSQILSENMSLGNEVSLYTFLRLCIEKFHYEETEFLEYINELIMENNEQITAEFLTNWFNQECHQSAR